MFQGFQNSFKNWNSTYGSWFMGFMCLRQYDVFCRRKRFKCPKLRVFFYMDDIPKLMTTFEIITPSQHGSIISVRSPEFWKTLVLNATMSMLVFIMPPSRGPKGWGVADRQHGGALVFSRKFSVWILILQILKVTKGSYSSLQLL